MSASIDSGYTTLHLLHGDETAGAFGQRKSRFGGALGTSILSHLLFFTVLYVLITLPPPPSVASPEPPFDPNKLVWADMRGPGGGGGGGGNKSPDPPRKLETKGPAQLS